MPVDDKNPIAASFGVDTKPQRAALKQPARTTSTAKDKSKSEVTFKQTTTSIGRGVEIPKGPEDEQELEDVKMKDGYIVRGVPKSATNAQIYEQYNKANGFSSVKGYDPGILQKSGDFLTDVGKALKINSGAAPVVALSRALFDTKEALAPQYDSNGTFQGFKQLSKQETARQRELSTEAYARAINAPEENSAADITAQVATQFLDPINISLLAVGGATNTWARFTKIFAAEGAAGGVTEVAQQTNEGAELTDVDKNQVALRAGLQGLLLLA